MSKNSSEGPDLSFVDPDRRTEVTRRIRLIEQFVRSPGRRNAEKAAAELGIGVFRFYKLVRIWREESRPERLTDVRRNRRRTDRIDQRIRAILRQIEKEHPTAPATRIEKIATVATKQQGLSLPSSPSVRSFIQKIRVARASTSPIGSGLAIDFCAIAVTVPLNGSSTLPVAAFVIDKECSMIVGLALSIRPDATTAARALLDCFQNGRLDDHRMKEPGQLEVTLNTTAEDGWSALVDVLSESGLRPHTKLQKKITSLRLAKATFGEKIGGVRLRPNATAKEPEERRASGLSLSIEVAETMLRSRLFALDGKEVQTRSTELHTQRSLIERLQSLGA